MVTSLKVRCCTCYNTESITTVKVKQAVHKREWAPQSRHQVYDAWPVWCQLLLPSKSQNITTTWPILNYTSWWQRYRDANNMT